MEEKHRFDLKNESLLIHSLSLFVCLSLMCKVCNSTSLCLPPFLRLLDISNPKTLLMNQKRDRKKTVFRRALGDLESYSFCIFYSVNLSSERKLIFQVFFFFFFNEQFQE